MSINIISLIGRIQCAIKCLSYFQKNIDGNHNDNNKRINDLAAKLAGLLKDSHDGLDALNKRLMAECNGLKSLMSKPLSVYFTAFRAEDYVEGGEAYLTFQGNITVNLILNE